MAQELKYTAVVLGKRDIGETDRLYIFYTKEKGKIIVVGKGTKKPDAKLAGNLETAMLSEVFVMQGKGRGKITGAIPLNYFLEIKKNQEILLKTLEIFRIFGKIVSEEEKDERVFNLLLGCLKTLEKKPEKAGIIATGFIFKFMDFLGYRAEAEKCASCGARLQPENNFFSASRGGVVCGKCSLSFSEKLKISPEAIKAIRIFLKNKIENFSKINIPEKDLKNLEIIQKQALAWIMD